MLLGGRSADAGWGLDGPSGEATDSPASEQVFPEPKDPGRGRQRR